MRRTENVKWEHQYSFKRSSLRAWLAGALILLAMSLASPGALAKDLHARLGLGYNSQFSNSSTTSRVPGISFKYGLTRDIAVALIVGGQTTSPLNSVTAAKFFKNVFYETNMNFYFMVAGGILSVPSGTTSQSAAEFMLGVGSEFFIPGIESLGFSVETGVTMGNATGSFVLQTLGVSFLDAGIHFYF